MVVAIHDVSFAAHPEWFRWREGARRRTIVRLAARSARRIITISRFSKREIIAHLGVERDKIVVAYPGVTAGLPNGIRRHRVAGTTDRCVRSRASAPCSSARSSTVGMSPS